MLYPHFNELTFGKRYNSISSERVDLGIDDIRIEINAVPDVDASVLLLAFGGFGLALIPFTLRNE